MKSSRVLMKDVYEYYVSDCKKRSVEILPFDLFLIGFGRMCCALINAFKEVN